MARRPPARVVMNREALTAIQLGYADGMQDEAEAILARAAPTLPDAPPYGKGVVRSGRAVTYVNGQKVSTAPGTAPLRGINRQGVVTVVGYGFPMRFFELGTINQPARPRLTPAMVAEVQGGMGAIPKRIIKRLAGVRSRR